MTPILKAVQALVMAAPEITPEHQKAICHAIRSGGRVRITVQDAARKMGVSRRTIWNYIKLGALDRLADDSKTPMGTIRGRKAVYVWEDAVDYLMRNPFPHKK